MALSAFLNASQPHSCGATLRHAWHPSDLCACLTIPLPECSRDALGMLSLLSPVQCLPHSRWLVIAELITMPFCVRVMRLRSHRNEQGAQSACQVTQLRGCGGSMQTRGSDFQTLGSHDAALFSL